MIASAFLGVASAAIAAAPAADDTKSFPFAPLHLPDPTPWRLADGNPGPEYWQQRVDYDIDAVLDEDAETIRGKARITYINNSPQELGFIWLHLEQNLFRAGSLAERSSLPGARFSNRSDFKGGIEVQSITSGGKNVPYVVYDTMARLDLPEPIAAGPQRGSIRSGGRWTFEITWTFRIPQYGVDRMGIEPFEQGKVFQIAQWFPAVAVYDDVHGWNTLPYLGQGEFYTNFGEYDVKLTVPRSHIVTATGELRNPRQVLTRQQIERLETARSGPETVMIRSAEEVADPASRPEGEGPLTWRFTAENVRTFAFASSASFIWDAARVEGTKTLAQSVYPKEASEVWTKSTDMLRFAIEGYNRRWFEYPYPVATNVFGNVGGMEYPMIIFCGDKGSEHGLYGLTTHEIGHNWFPMVVNTDERRHAWMDEGFDSFINIYSEADRFNDGKVERRGRDFAHLLRPGLPPVETPPDQLGPGLLGSLQYAKVAVALHMLREEVLGPERFDRAFREYIRRWAFKSPRPADFYRTMENVAGMDLSWFWRGWIVEARSLDQGVEAVEQSDGSPTATVTFVNVGDMVMPVSFRATYDDGTTYDSTLPVEVWYWTPHWKTDIPAVGKRVVKVHIDPRGVYPDIDPRNNAWEAPKPEPAPDPSAPAAEAPAAEAAPVAK